MLYHICFVLEVLCEVGQKLIGIFDKLDILSDDPNNGSLGIRVIQTLQVLANIFKDPLILVRILSEHISDDDDSFLDNVIDFGFQSLP